MLNEAHVVVDDCPRLVHHTPQIADVFPHDGRYLVQLLELVPVMLGEHAAGAHKHLAVATKVFDRLVRVPGAVDLTNGRDAGLRGPYRVRLLDRPVRLCCPGVLRPGRILGGG